MRNAGGVPITMTPKMAFYSAKNRSYAAGEGPRARGTNRGGSRASLTPRATGLGNGATANSHELADVESHSAGPLWWMLAELAIAERLS
jgi:hypothetical protein